MEEEGSTGWQNPDDELYVPLLTGAQRLFGTENLDSLNVGISKDANVDEVMMTIERILRAQHDIGPGDEVIVPSFKWALEFNFLNIIVFLR